ncbi:hypothetical protein ADL29_30100 [Streptomyces chattanoogensis]|uniref:Uncharacterized protein n=1 Tax=Streptomyces chattanoogensis TaxID=66876 RepID=A0A0N0XRT1_9ACTN|nr:hypothetical protein ADL29_30100 [Streptomyces chattanoogensis]
MALFQRTGHQVTAALGHLAARPAVESGVDQHVGAGRTEQVGAGLERGWVDQVTLWREDGTLFRSAAGWLPGRLSRPGGR